GLTSPPGYPNHESLYPAARTGKMPPGSQNKNNRQPNLIQGDRTYVESDEIRREGRRLRGPGCLGGLRAAESHQPQRRIHPQVERKASAQELAERKATPRLAPHH